MGGPKKKDPTRVSPRLPHIAYRPLTEEWIPGSIIHKMKHMNMEPLVISLFYLRILYLIKSDPQGRSLLRLLECYGGRLVGVRHSSVCIVVRSSKKLDRHRLSRRCFQDNPLMRFVHGHVVKASFVHGFDWNPFFSAKSGDIGYTGAARD